jgi:FMN-dependent NADH-azoreductase
MSTIFRLDASIRQDGSVTRAVADTLESTIAEELGSTEVLRRDIGTNPLDGSIWGTAAFAGDELVAADALIFAVPLYNFGVSQHFKTWFDIVATDSRFHPGAETLAGKPAFLVTARGGGYGPGTPREGWDHATGWMRRVLEDVWSLDLDVIETELTLAEVQPQMAELRDLAREQLAESHEAARRGARSVTLRLRPAA